MRPDGFRPRLSLGANAGTVVAQAARHPRRYGPSVVRTLEIPLGDDDGPRLVNLRGWFDRMERLDAARQPDVAELGQFSIVTRHPEGTGFRLQ